MMIIILALVVPIVKIQVKNTLFFSSSLLIILNSFLDSILSSLLHNDSLIAFKQQTRVYSGGGSSFLINNSFKIQYSILLLIFFLIRLIHTV